ncbi:hypothetical protein AURANDRAFT_67321 [Aureococcus anophagefferens]|uniref:Uncharacterized protein n=1 Tax=Aureococcus anophagefferens TaxID=44056 RepID=F0YKR6_AURAN|nr:hypothetical protein AURANDRAFT_67321 [Aureococcus anophagefferens]EGB04315.1 hypothetical protein AURANDRAFT_67321 [Aureococcus anophagefferens]|eukprot:XP_009041025.1 hypothetical protein AURANDRAFT_67321 [Aureococcus anophagefferens]
MDKVVLMLSAILVKINEFTPSSKNPRSGSVTERGINSPAPIPTRWPPTGEYRNSTELLSDRVVSIVFAKVWLRHTPQEKDETIAIGPTGYRCRRALHLGHAPCHLAKQRRVPPLRSDPTFSFRGPEHAEPSVSDRWTIMLAAQGIRQDHLDTLPSFVRIGSLSLKSFCEALSVRPVLTSAAMRHNSSLCAGKMVVSAD